MPPITLTSTDDDANLNFDPKERLENHCVDPLLTSDGAVAEEGRGDDDDASADPGDREPSDQADEPRLGRKQSNLFVDESQVIGGVAEQFSNGNDVHSPPPSAFAVAGGLSLMPSSSSLDTASCGNSLTSLDMENVDLGAQQLFKFDDLAVTMLSQIEADEELARHLQEEENKFKWKTPKEPKPRVVPSFADSLLGAPSPWEVRANYTRVEKPKNENSSSSSNAPDSSSGGLSMFTKSFKKWGTGFTAAATNFFGEDIAMQTRRPPSNKKGDTSKNADGQYRNAV